MDTGATVHIDRDKIDRDILAVNQFLAVMETWLTAANDRLSHPLNPNDGDMMVLTKPGMSRATKYCTIFDSIEDRHAGIKIPRLRGELLDWGDGTQQRPMVFRVHAQTLKTACNQRIRWANAEIAFLAVMRDVISIRPATAEELTRCQPNP